MKSSIRRLVVAVAGVLLLFGVGSASAAPIPFFYLVPTGPGVVPTVVSAGSTTLQLWVDATGVNDGAGNVGVIGIQDVAILGHGALTMTAFSAIAGAPAFTLSNLVNSTELLLSTGDTGATNPNGQPGPWEVGTLTVNDAGGAGDVTLWSGDYFDAAFNNPNVTAPQTLASAIPEPGTLVLLGAGMGGLAVLIGRSRSKKS